MERKGYKQGNLVFWAIFAVILLISASAGMSVPSEIITSKGCILNQDSVNKFSCWVKNGTKVTLTGPAGYSSYVWSGSDQNNPSITVVVKNDIVLNLTLDGSKVKTVFIYLKSIDKSNCVFGLSDIKIDGVAIVDTATVAVGQNFTASVTIDKRRCPDSSGANFSWVGDKKLFIKKPNSATTEISVLGRSDSGKNLELSVQSVNGFQSVKKTLSLIVIVNTPPTIAGYFHYTTPLSHRSIIFDCDDCKTGNNTNEYNDKIVSLSITIMDKQGVKIDSHTNTVRKDSKQKPRVTLDLKDECNCTVEVIAIDAYGAKTVAREILLVEFGNTLQDAPNIKLVEPVKCKGLNCTFDTDGTESHFEKYGTGLYRRYYIKTVIGKYEEMYNINGVLCTTPKCVKELPGNGSYDIKITMQYTRDNKPSGKIAEKFITLCLGEDCKTRSEAKENAGEKISGESSEILPTSSKPRAPQYVVGTYPPERYNRTPGIGGITTIFVFALVILVLRTKIK